MYQLRVFLILPHEGNCAWQQTCERAKWQDETLVRPPRTIVLSDSGQPWLAPESPVDLLTACVPCLSCDDKNDHQFLWKQHPCDFDFVSANILYMISSRDISKLVPSNARVSLYNYTLHNIYLSISMNKNSSPLLQEMYKHLQANSKDSKDLRLCLWPPGSKSLRPEATTNVLFKNHCILCKNLKLIRSEM